MSGSPFGALRRRIAVAGARPATTRWTDLPHASPGNAPAVDVVEEPFGHHEVGAPLAWHDDVAFLDGSQHVELVGHVGIEPLVAAVINAAVRLRIGRRMRVAVVRSRPVVVARPHVIDRLGAALEDHVVIPLAGDDAPHPVRDLERCHSAIDVSRAALEGEVAQAFRAQHDCWMVVDGTLALHAEWTADPRMVGVVKSHGMLPLTGAMLESYLSLPAGCRTSVFSPRTPQRQALHAWGLRLQPWEGRDLFHGLVRVEVAAGPEPTDAADRLSRHLLAERTPFVAAARGDRTLYGIHDVNRYLRLHGASA